jgi:hypothetical protein
MKKICIAIGLIMAINTSWAQVSVDDDNFALFVKAQNESRREIDSINNLELLSRVAKFDSVKVVVVPPKPVEKPKVVKKEIPKPVVVVESVVQAEPPKLREPFNKYYIEDNYLIGGTSVFSENYLAGIKFETSLRDKSYVLFKLVKKNVALNNTNRNGDYFTGTYFVPISWWNDNFVAGSLTYEQIEHIKDNFQMKYKY